MHVCHMRFVTRGHQKYVRPLCVSYEEEDTCMSYEEEDTCIKSMSDPVCVCVCVCVCV